MRSRDAGIVLLVVLFFVLLLGSGVATFVKRATIDAMIARNRENAARADALARGGVRLAQALLIEDRLREDAGVSLPVDSIHDPWALIAGIEIPTETGTLRLRIEDVGARLNLNALFEVDEGGLRQASESSALLLHALLEKVIEELPIPPAQKSLYDADQLAVNLIDWIDADDLREDGGPEDDYYQRQDPPYRSANRPLLSLDELRLVEGYDAALVDALRSYATVYPFAPGGCADAAKGCGVNLNTAPPHVLALLFYSDGVDQRLADEDVVRRILRARQEAGLICGEGQSLEGCTPISEIVTNAILPPPTFRAEIFVVEAEARVGEVRRTIEAVVDRSQLATLRLLSWRVR